MGLIPLTRKNRYYRIGDEFDQGRLLGRIMEVAGPYEEEYVGRIEDLKMEGIHYLGDIDCSHMETIESVIELWAEIGEHLRSHQMRLVLVDIENEYWAWEEGI